MRIFEFVSHGAARVGDGASICRCRVLCVFRAASVADSDVCCAWKFGFIFLSHIHRRAP